MKALWEFLQFFAIVVWVMYTFLAICFSIEGHVKPLYIVMGIDIIIASYYLFIRKK